MPASAVAGGRARPGPPSPGAGVTVDDLRVPVAAGVHLRVRRHAAGGAGRAFLLVHGLASNALLWDQVADRLAAAGHPSYAVDLRSHGESDAPSEGYDTQTAAEDVAAVADHLGLSEVVVVGQSWGGGVVVHLAVRRPDLAAGLVLVDGGWYDLSASFPSWQECAQALRPPDVDGRPAAELREFLRRQHPDWAPAAIDATMANLRVRPDGTLERRLPVDRHMLIVRSMWDAPSAPLLRQVKAPVLLISAIPADGERVEQRRTTVRSSAAALAQATVKEYEGADHDLHAQHPDELAADLLDFESRLT